jgi:hypothetical protein
MNRPLRNVILACWLPGILLLGWQDTEKEDPKVAVQQILDRAKTADVDKLWPLANELIDLGKDKGGKVNSRVEVAMRGALKETNPKVALVASRALLQLDKTHYSDEVASGLVTLMENNKDEAESAAKLLGSDAVVLNSKDEGKILEKLRNLIETGGLSAKARIAAAYALWKHGSSDDRGIALREMKAFLRSQDLDLRIEGALALAAAEALEGTREATTILSGIQHEPTERGRLARLYLKNEDAMRLARERNEKLLRPDGDSGTIKPLAKSGEQLDPGDPRILEDIIALIRTRHIQGDQWSREDLVAAAARGMLNELDPHSTFMTPQEFQKMF